MVDSSFLRLRGVLELCDNFFVFRSYGSSSSSRISAASGREAVEKTSSSDGGFRAAGRATGLESCVAIADVLSSALPPSPELSATTDS
jgi:hypothetical protein